MPFSITFSDPQPADQRAVLGPGAFLREPCPLVPCPGPPRSSAGGGGGAASGSGGSCDPDDLRRWSGEGDERSAENERRANATLFTLLFLGMGGLLLWTKTGQTLTLGRSELLVIFGSVCLLQDILFLLYERFGA